MKEGKKMNYKKHLWRRRLCDEFGITVKELILSFATEGYSMRLTIGALGINMETLRNYCRREGIQFPDRAHLRAECKPRPGASAKGHINNPWGRAGKPFKKGKNETNHRAEAGVKEIS